MGIIWSIIIGFLAGLIAKWITPGDNKPARVYPHHGAGHYRGGAGDLAGAGDRLVWAE